MPHKYEREIEEILKNMQRNEPETDARERSRGFPRSAGGPGFRLGLSASELLLLLGVAFALAGACVMWFDGNKGGNPISGILGLVGFVLFVAGLIVAFQASRRPPPPAWRGNVVEMKTHRRGPLDEIATQLRLLRLRLRYRRGRDPE
jgi:hypothetical protein